MPNQPMRPQRQFESDKNPVFIVIPRQHNDHHKVKDFVVRQGRVNENYQGSFMFIGVPTPVLRLKYKSEGLNKEPDTVEAIAGKLTTFVVPESEEYALTEQGKAEIHKFADFIFKYPDKRAM